MSTTTPTGLKRARTRHFRSDIQALRAVSIGIVVLYHLWPNRLPGGFIGVDVFFVISGYLITSHIIKSLDHRQPRKFLIGFYARRIRRLAPAAAVVLGAVLAATCAFLPVTAWQDVAPHLLASSLFYENWHLAADSVSYLEANAAPSALQHFWSLSVEEQFYIVWPLLLIGAALMPRFHNRRSLVTIIAVVGVLSFAWSLYYTEANPSPAFFNTPARVWQFAAGALLAFAPALPRRVAIPTAWAGVVTIAAGSFLLTGAAPYPGFAALIPTAAAVAIIAANAPADTAASVVFYGRIRPVQWIGDTSYSAYLWHWPLIVLMPAILGTELTTALKVSIIVATGVLGWLSYRFVETPIRRSRSLSTKTIRSFVAGAAALVVIVGSTVTTVQIANAETEAAADALIASTTDGDPCFAAAAVDNASCGNPWGKADPKLIAAAPDDGLLPWIDDCRDGIEKNTTAYCTYGDKESDDIVLLWGDSHAGQWADALDVAGKLNHEKVIVAARSACPSSVTPPSAGTYGKPIDEDTQRWCDARNDWVLDTLVPKADRVVLANFYANYIFPGGDEHQQDGYVELVRELTDLGHPVTMMQGVPLTGTPKTRIDGPQCLLTGEVCKTRQADAYDRTNEPIAAVKDAQLGDTVSYVPVSDRFCHDGLCYYAVGGVAVYYDEEHISGTYSRSLGPWLATKLAKPTPIAEAAL